MPSTLRDGRGKGYLAGVNLDNQLMVNGVSVSSEHFINHSYEKAFNLIWKHTVTTGNDKLIHYIKNTGNKLLVFEGFQANVSANVEFYAKGSVLGTPVGGTDMDLANLTIGSGNTLDLTAKYGDGITGITGGTLFWRSKLAGSNSSSSVNFDADIIVKPQTAVAIYASSSGYDGLGFYILYEDQDGV
jgi:archaellum component FlaG (FlaF/FlaG flagellin family)